MLAGSPVGPNGGSRYLPPDARFDLVLDAPADLRGGRAAPCTSSSTSSAPRPAPVRLAVESQRPVTADDRWDFREAGGWDRDRTADPLRRVVRLAPRTPLPHGCAGELVVPSSFDDRGSDPSSQRWALATYGDFRLERGRVRLEPDPTAPPARSCCTFSTPVRGADVRRHVTLRPAVPFELGDTADLRSQWVLDARLAPRTAYAVVLDRGLTDGFGQPLTGNPVASPAPPATRRRSTTRPAEPWSSARGRAPSR